ncbi:MAG: tetratricopeptide repeat protein [Planctomycetota bacterium]
MTASRTDILKEYVELLADAPPSERAALLEQVRQQHPEITADLASMLPFLDDAEEILLGGRSTKIPEFIGRYRIVRLLAHGGMGEVFLAIEPPPLERHVAIKIIRPGFVSREMVRRFEFERDALKALEHPHIARITDGGETEDGLPFVAMEYIDGVTLDEFIRSREVTLSQRVRLMQQVCAAVAFAHLKGVMHRDLKPGNVMVKLVGDVPQARVIDFGIAKALDHSIVAGASSQSQTSPGFPIGTLEFMSPEQVQGLLSSVDRRSDIYALGAMLYWICTGCLARTREQLLAWAGPGFLESLDRNPIPQPSSCMNGLARQLGPIKGRPRELDWIILKALEHDPDRRYQTVEELTRDIERWRSGDEVAAAPPSHAYRLQKFVKRHPLSAGIAATAVVGLVSVTVTRSLADAQVRRALSETQEALADREAALADADAAAGFLSGMISSASPRGSRPDRTVTDMIDEFAPFVAERLAGAPVARWRVRQMLAETYRLRGDPSSAIDVGERSVADAIEAWGEDSSQRAESLIILAQVRLNAGQFAEARTDASEAVRIAERLGEDEISLRLRAQKLLATASFAVGDGDAALAQFRELINLLRIHEPNTLNTASSLLLYVDLLARSGELDEAATALGEAERIAAGLSPTSPQLDQTIIAANGSIAFGRGDIESAASYARQLAEHCEQWYGPDHGATLEARLAAITHDAELAGSWSGLLDDCRDIEQRSRKLESNPVTRTKALHRLGLALLDTNDPESALTHLNEAIELHRTFFGNEDPTEAIYLATRARAFFDLGRKAAAEADARRAEDFQSPLVQDELTALQSWLAN